MDVEEALADARAWQALPDANGAAHALADELERVRARARLIIDGDEAGYLGRPDQVARFIVTGSSS